MQQAAAQYNSILHAETQKLLDTYDEDLIANLSDDEIDQLAEILVERTDIITGNTDKMEA